MVLKNELVVEFITDDANDYPINIYGVDIFGRRKDTINFSQKAKKINSL